MKVLRKLSVAEKANLIANRSMDLIRQGLDDQTARAILEKEYPSDFIKKDIYLVED